MIHLGGYTNEFTTKYHNFQVKLYFVVSWLKLIRVHFFLPHCYILYKSKFSLESRRFGRQDLIQGIRALQNYWKAWVSEGQKEPLPTSGKSDSANCL